MFNRHLGGNHCSLRLVQILIAIKRRKFMSTSPTQLTLKWLREHGYIADVVERWIGGQGGFGRRRDLFGFVDIVAVSNDPETPEIRFIQTTTQSNMMARFEKMKGIPAVATCIRAGCKVEIHGWAKRGARGKRKLWMPRFFCVRVRDDSGAIEYWESEEEIIQSEEDKAKTAAAELADLKNIFKDAPFRVHYYPKD